MELHIASLVRGVRFQSCSTLLMNRLSHDQLNRAPTEFEYVDEHDHFQ